MESIYQHTSIPVPKVYCAFKHGRTYIVTERISGNKLAIGWMDRSEDSRARLLAQLKSMVDEMRNVKPLHSPSIASVDGRSLYDMRLPSLGVIYPIATPKRFGPFEDIPAFHRWLRRPVKQIEDGNSVEVNDLIRLYENTN